LGWSGLRHPPGIRNWKWVKEQIAADAPVPYDANDPDDGPYDPNDDAAIDRYLTEANRIYPTASGSKNSEPGHPPTGYL